MADADFSFWKKLFIPNILTYLEFQQKSMKQANIEASQAEYFIKQIFQEWFVLIFFGYENIFYLHQTVELFYQLSCRYLLSYTKVFFEK